MCRSRPVAARPAASTAAEQRAPPAMADLPDSARAVLESSALAHLVTLEPDGRPQVSVVWVGLEGDEIVAAHLAERRKVRNMRRDPRVTLSLEAGTLNTRGLVELIVLNVAYDAHVFSATLFTMLIAMALITTLMTAPLLNLLGIQKAAKERGMRPSSGERLNSA